MAGLLPGGVISNVNKKIPRPPPSQLGRDSPSEDQPAPSHEATSSETAELSSEERPAPLESRDLASTSNNRIDGRESMTAMATRIWRILFPCLSVEEENIFKVAGVNDNKGLINDISQLLDLIRQGEPTTGHDDHDFHVPEELSCLLTFLSTGRKEKTDVASHFNDFSEAMTVVEELLEIIGAASFVTAGFLVVSYGLKRFQDVSDNKEECLNILEEMNMLNRLVNQCAERDRLKEGMQDEIIEATKLIMNGSIKCLTQIRSSPFSKLLHTSGNQQELVKIKGDLEKKHREIYFKMQICIVDAVSNKPRLSREYPKHAVGIEQPIKEVIDLLELGSEKSAVAVILYGFGGIGKTTLADAVFNKIEIQKVDGKDCKYSHVELFRNMESSPDVIKLQKKILEDLMGSETIPDIRKYQDGQLQLQSILQNVPAFIYVDNVLDKDALRQLLPRNLDTAKKVRLLITARDINVGKACRMKTPPKEYRMRGTPYAAAKSLLKDECSSSEAAKSLFQDSNSDRLNRIIEKCGTIPLMLNLVAQELCCAKEEREVCEVIEELEKLEGEEFGVKLESYFFVYDKLPKECKEPFLDICSFFLGWGWDMVADIVGKSALERLERRALVAKGTNEVVTVPDIILEVGRRKAKGTSLRFTAESELINFLRDNEKAEQLRYLTYKPAKDLNQLIESNLKMPPNVKYMEIDGTLHCDNLEIFPVRLLHLPDLRILKLINFQGLKELPSLLADLVNGLRELTLSNCKSFKELPYSISKLKSLRVLRMQHCAAVQKLPHDLGNLVSLVDLDLSNCQGLEQLPIDFGFLKSLEIVNFKHCESLSVLPDSFEELVSLRVLNLSFCKALEHLPGGLGKIASLYELDISHCEKLTEIPRSIGLLKKLRRIDISWCSNLTELPDEFCGLISITYLKLTRCGCLKILPEQFGNLQSLEILKLKSCTGLQKLPDSFSKLKSLVHLDLSNCSGLEDLCEDFHCLLLLKTLSLDGCKKLQKLPKKIQFLPSLQHLDLSSCQMLEGQSMDSVLESKTLTMVCIAKSDKLKERWPEAVQTRESVQGDHSRDLKVDTGEDLPEQEKKSEWKKISPKFERLLQNGQGEQFQLSKRPPNTILLVMFDGQLDFKQDFPWPLIGETIEDNRIDFEIVYIGKHFNKLPKTVANKITGRALDNTDARLQLEKVFFTLQRNGVNLWHQKMNKYFSMSATIVDEANDDNHKYLSCWKLLSPSQMEEFLLSKCGRYLWLKQLAAKTQESNIQLLRELFVNGRDDYRLYKKTLEVKVDELKGKTILLEIRPAKASFDVVRLQALKDLYEQKCYNIEIITIPIGQLSTRFEQFSADIPWLVLQNSWKMTRAVKYFLIKECQWEEGDWERSETWYPGRVRIIESNGRMAPYEPVLSMLERWGSKVYPFTREQIEELRKEEWSQLKSMTNLKLLFKPLQVEFKDKVMPQRKMIGLLCDGKDPDTKRLRTKGFVGSITSAMKHVMDSIHFIYVAHYDEKNKTVETVTDGISMPYFPMEESRMPELKGLLPLSSLLGWDAMRFWMRVCYLRKEIKGMDENEKQLDGMRRLLNSLDRRYLSLVFIDEDGEVVTTKGREIVGIFEDRKVTATKVKARESAPEGDQSAEKLNKSEAKKLVEDLIKGSPQERKQALRELESRLP